jgi:hypothetical protein
VHVSYSQIFIIGYLLSSIFNATLDSACQISFAKLSLPKKIKNHNFPSQLWHIHKVCNPFFPKVANCAIFQKKKEKEKSLVWWERETITNNELALILLL